MRPGDRVVVCRDNPVMLVGATGGVMETLAGVSPYRLASTSPMADAQGCPIPDYRCRVRWDGEEDGVRGSVVLAEWLAPVVP